MTNYLIGLAVATVIAMINGVAMYLYAKRRLERATKALLEDWRARVEAPPAAR